MTIEEIIYDIIEIKHAITDDSDLDEMFLLQKINNYRAIYIQESYKELPTINSEWLQRTGKLSVEKVNSADDPAISVSSITLGKVEIPAVVSLPEDIGFYRVSGSSAISSFDHATFPELMLKIWEEDDIDRNYGLASKIGNTIYLYPYTLEIQALLVGENPLDFPVLENNVWRDRVFSDDYPVDAAMAQKIVLDILTKDLNILEKSIEDLINDGQVQLKLMKNGQN